MCCLIKSGNNNKPFYFAIITKQKRNNSIKRIKLDKAKKKREKRKQNKWCTLKKKHTKHPCTPPR